MNVNEVVHWYIVKVLNDKREVVECLKWSGLKWELRLKYDWFFRYRAALLQIKYPKFEVVSNWGNEPAQGKTLNEILDVKIRVKKAKITEYKNKLQRFKDSYNELFPMRQNKDYQKALAKILSLEIELEDLLNEKEQINTNH